MVEATTTIDLGGEGSQPEETSIDEIHIETTEERLLLLYYIEHIVLYVFLHRQIVFGSLWRPMVLFVLYFIFVG